MRKYGNEEKLGGRKPVELVLQLHVVVVVDLTLKFARRLCKSLPVDRAFRLTVLYQVCWPV